MKKFFKFLGSAALLCATVAGGIFAYKKFFAPDPFADDLDDDLEDEATETENPERGYVSLSSPEKEEAEKPEEAEEPQEEASPEPVQEETTEE